MPLFNDVCQHFSACDVPGHFLWIAEITTADFAAIETLAIWIKHDSRSPRKLYLKPNVPDALKKRLSTTRLSPFIEFHVPSDRLFSLVIHNAGTPLPTNVAVHAHIIEKQGLLASYRGTFVPQPQINTVLWQQFLKHDPLQKNVPCLLSVNERVQTFLALQQLRVIEKQIAILDLGCFLGGVSHLLDSALSEKFSRDRISMTQIDCFPQSEFLLRHQKNPDPRITFFPKFSHQAVNDILQELQQGSRPLFSVVFLDGDCVDGIGSDIKLYYWMLAAGGLLFVMHHYPPFHDDWKPALAERFQTEFELYRPSKVADACKSFLEKEIGLKPLPLPLAFPNLAEPPTAHWPIIPEIKSTLVCYQKPLS